MATLSRDFGFSTMVETGTFVGNTTSWASDTFEKVFSVEASPIYFKEASTRFSSKRNIRLFLNENIDALPKILAELSGPALFWLDAHWSGGDTAGADCECPLLEELEVILRASPQHLVLVDDARLFLAPPPPPHKPEAWPTLEQIIATVRQVAPATDIAVFDDVIFIVPHERWPRFQTLMHERQTA